MGYLDNSSITVDAILTKRGRELLARNDGSFKITQFALGDDEIDYSLFNESHPNGTQFSAEAIENMPLIEAIPHGANSLNSKLITLTRGTNAVPFITAGSFTNANGPSILQGASLTITPTTFNLNGANAAASEEYIFTILDGRLVEPGSFAATGGSVVASASDIAEFMTIAESMTIRGTILTLQATTSNALFSTSITSNTTQIIIEGVTSGAFLTIPLEIKSN
jgi:hypothetical protein